MEYTLGVMAFMSQPKSEQSQLNLVAINRDQLTDIRIGCAACRSLYSKLQLAFLKNYTQYHRPRAEVTALYYIMEKTSWCVPYKPRDDEVDVVAAFDAIFDAEDFVHDMQLAYLVREMDTIHIKLKRTRDPRVFTVRYHVWFKRYNRDFKIDFQIARYDLLPLIRLHNGLDILL